MTRRLTAALGAALAFALLLAGPAAAADTAGSVADRRAERVQARLSSIGNDPIAMRQFFVGLPKGADLHQHLSGTVYAEPMLSWAAADGLCLTPATWALSAPPCTSPAITAASVLNDAGTQAQIVNQWSMRFFTPTGTDSGHNHFFATFGLFGWVFSPQRVGDGLAQVLTQAARDHVVRVETKVTPNGSGASALATALVAAAPAAATDPSRFGEALAILRSAGLEAQATVASTTTDIWTTRAAADLGCGTPDAQPGCSVDYDFVAQTNRNAPPANVFSSLAVAFATASHDARWVGVDLVGPEDGVTSLADYGLHMQMVRFLSQQYPGVRIDLHAGELVPSLVPPADLTSHVEQAVRIAGTDRVGHGVDIAGEQDARSLMRLMRTRHVTVEIALSSNQQILKVGPRTSQFRTYRAAGVPMVLVTDDAGVSRSDLSEQYAMAYRWFHLTYADLKALSYQGVRSAFVSTAERRVLLGRLDAAFARFERTWS